MSVVVILRGIFFQKAATFTAILGTREGFRCELPRWFGRNQLAETVGSKSSAVMTTVWAEVSSWCPGDRSLRR